MIAAIAVVIIGAGAGILVTRRHRHTDETARVAPPPAPPPPAVTAPAAVPDATLAPTIAQLAARDDWDAVLQACSAAAQPTADETKACAIAACNTKQRDVAVRYFKATQATDRSAIERACADNGVALAKTPKPGRHSKDPCADPAYVEANPLKCM